MKLASNIQQKLPKLVSLKYNRALWWSWRKEPIDPSSFKDANLPTARLGLAWQTNHIGFVSFGKVNGLLQK